MILQKQKTPNRNHWLNALHLFRQGIRQCRPHIERLILLLSPRPSPWSSVPSRSCGTPVSTSPPTNGNKNLNPNFANNKTPTNLAGCHPGSVSKNYGQRIHSHILRPGLKNITVGLIDVANSWVSDFFQNNMFSNCHLGICEVASRRRSNSSEALRRSWTWRNDGGMNSRRDLFSHLSCPNHNFASKLQILASHSFFFSFHFGQMWGEGRRDMERVRRRKVKVFPRPRAAETHFEAPSR
jgi:hypothetical protein